MEQFDFSLSDVNNHLHTTDLVSERNIYVTCTYDQIVGHKWSALNVTDVLTHISWFTLRSVYGILLYYSLVGYMFSTLQNWVWWQVCAIYIWITMKRWLGKWLPERDILINFLLCIVTSMVYALIRVTCKEYTFSDIAHKTSEVRLLCIFT
jgi:hypothetical protein